MDLIAVLHTTEYRGDHSAEVQVTFAVADGETVEGLVRRTHQDNPWTNPDNTYVLHPRDWVELRAVQE